MKKLVDLPIPERIDRERRVLLASAAYFPALALTGAAFAAPELAVAQDSGAQVASVAAGIGHAGDRATPPARFFDLSKTLTGHPELNPALQGPAWRALVAREPNFPEHFAQLSAALPGSSLSALASDPTLKAVAMAVIGAWYLGRVGEVKPRSEDGPAFITYTGALMWRPTVDVTVIPTYSRGGPGHWASAPASLASD